MSLVLFDDAWTERESARIGVDEIGDLEDAFLEGRRRGHDLERRARLVDVLNRPVALLVVSGLLDRVGIERRVTREREDFSRVRIHDDGGAAGRAIGFHTGRQLALSDVLQVQIERELDGRTRGRRLLNARIHALSARVHLEQHAPRAAPNDAVVSTFDTAEPFIVDTDEAEYVRGQFQFRVIAARPRDDANAGQLQGLQPWNLVGHDLSIEICELTLAAEFSLNRSGLLGVAVAECLTDLRDRFNRIVHFARVRHEGIAIDGVRQDLAVAVHDVAARREQRHFFLLLADRQRQHLLVSKHLKVHEPRFDAGRPESQGAQHDQDAAPQLAAPSPFEVIVRALAASARGIDGRDAAERAVGRRLARGCGGLPAPEAEKPREHRRTVSGRRRRPPGRERTVSPVRSRACPWTQATPYAGRAARCARFAAARAASRLRGEACG